MAGVEWTIKNYIRQRILGGGCEGGLASEVVGVLLLLPVTIRRDILWCGRWVDDGVLTI